MSLIKHRPKLALLVQRELHAGGKHEGTVVVDARRPVEVEWVKVEIVGEERGTIGSGNSSRTVSNKVAHLEARLAGERTLEPGRTELPFRFALPDGAPPSYRGRAAAATYTARVQASIPWWPDSRAAFEINVSPRPAPFDAGAPLLFSSEPSGPRGREAHVEGSLAASVFEPGGLVEGAFALGNVEWNVYKAVDVGLISVETVTLPRATPRRSEAHRYELSVEVGEPGEGEAIPFRFRLPEEVPVTHASGLWRLDWFFEARARVGWKSDVRLRVPVVVRRSDPAGGRTARPHRAPPAVGSERLETLWRAVAAEVGLAYEPGLLTTRLGEVELEVRREHRGKRGVFLVGEARYPSLGLGLDVRPAHGLDRAFGQGIELGRERWDRDHRVRGREERQVRAAMEVLRPALVALGSCTVGDERATAELRGGGGSQRKLAVFCQALRALAASVDAARGAIPPPETMEGAVGAWRELASALRGRLEIGSMSVRGDVGGAPAEVRTEWVRSGEPLRTVLVVEPALPIAPEHEAHLERSDGTGLEAVAPWTAATAQARELAARLLDAGLVLDVGEDEVRLTLPAPLLDPAPLAARLADMARLAVALRSGGGPFR